MLTILPEGLERPLVFAPEAAHVADMLGSVLNGWPMRTDVPGMEPLLHVSADGREILLQRPQDGATFREPSAVSAVCSLVVETVDALAAASPDLVCLHAAAAELGGRLVLFPAAHRAGKSTLVARLAADGRRVFADDILPFDLHREDAVATGCLPRLRLPLPRGSSPALRRHVRERTVASDGYYAYVASQGHAMVRFGERLPIGAVVLLERSGTPVQARLEDAPPDKALLEILTRNTRGDRDAPLLLSTFASVINDVPVKRLVYSDLEDAVSFLEDGFSGAPPSTARRSRMPRFARKPSVPKLPAKSSAATAGTEATPKGNDLLYRRNPSVKLDRAGGSGFLADPGDNGIHVLDTVGLGVWTLLETPQDASSLTAIVSGAFPDVPRETIGDDVVALLTVLAEKRLVERLDGKKRGSGPEGA